MKNIWKHSLIVAIVGFVVFFLAGIPALWAHSSERIFIVTLPLGYYYATGAMVVLATFVLVLLLPKKITVLPKKLGIFPMASLCRFTHWLSFLALVLLVIVGFVGSRDPLENILVLMVWTVLWVVLTLLTVIFANVWDFLNPWCAAVKLTRKWLGVSETQSNASIQNGAKGILDKLGYFPAIIGFFGFAWFEIISLAPDDPAVLAQSVLIYWGIIFILACYQGEGWLEKGEFFTVFFRFIGRIAPLWIQREGNQELLMLGFPGKRMEMMPTLSKTAIAFVVLVLASVSFDGFADSFFWLLAIGVNPLAFEGRSNVLEINSAGLLSAWLLSGMLILSVIALSCFVGRVKFFWQEAGRMVATFLPIAAAYHIAHYFTALLINMQYLIKSFSDPFGLGWNIFALPHHFVTTSFMKDYSSQIAIWNFQSAVIVIGHVIAVILACSNSHVSHQGVRGKIAHFPMTLLMMLYTIFGLWLLSTPTGGA